MAANGTDPRLLRPTAQFQRAVQCCIQHTEKFQKYCDEIPVYCRWEKLKPDIQERNQVSRQKLKAILEYFASDVRENVGRLLEADDQGVIDLYEVSEEIAAALKMIYEAKKELNSDHLEMAGTAIKTLARDCAQILGNMNMRIANFPPLQGATEVEVEEFESETEPEPVKPIVSPPEPPRSPRPIQHTIERWVIWLVLFAFIFANTISLLWGRIVVYTSMLHVIPAYNMFFDVNVNKDTWRHHLREQTQRCPAARLVNDPYSGRARSRPRTRPTQAASPEWFSQTRESSVDGSMAPENVPAPVNNEGPLIRIPKTRIADDTSLRHRAQKPRRTAPTAAAAANDTDSSSPGPLAKPVKQVRITNGLPIPKHPMMRGGLGSVLMERNITV